MDRTHVLVTVDCDVCDVEALGALKLLTDARDVKVTGLYVEDSDVVNASRLPGMAEVSRLGSISSLDPEHVHHQITAEAQRAQQQFESSARRMHLNHSFRIARGRLAEKLLEAAAESDFVVINRSLRGAGLRSRRADHFAPLVRQHSNLLFVNEPWASGVRIVVLHDPRSDRSKNALATAQRFARAEELELVIAVRAQTSIRLEEAPGRLVALANWNEDTIVDLCEAEDARLLVVPPLQNLDWRELLLGLADRLRCSLLRLD